MKKVKWQYRHYLNSSSYTVVTKIGDYYGKVKHTVRYSGPQLAIVQFVGNKSYSRVPFNELKFI